MRIYIPSRGRWHRQTTVKNLPYIVLPNVTIVVPVDQYESYSRNMPTMEVVAPDIPSGIGPCRQWCCEQQDRKVIMMDDDLVFARRRIDVPTKFEDAGDEDVLDMLADIENMLDLFAHVGVSTREGGNRDTLQFAYDTRLLRILAFRTDILKEEGIRFDQIPVMEDFYVGLSLLTRGYRNIKLNYIVHNQHGSGTEGGCSTYRDKEMQRDAALKLAGMFPQFVTAVEKETKGAWGGGVRTDVRIQWKRALESAGGIQEL
jgi:hypothetical protein